MNKSTTEDLCKFLSLGARLDLKSFALDHILGLTGSPEGVRSLIDNQTILLSLLSLLNDNNPTISKNAALTLINISASETGSEVLLNLDLDSFAVPLQSKPENIVKTLLNLILDENSHISDPCCMILSNLTRPTQLVAKTIALAGFPDKSLDALITAFTKSNYNNKGATLHYLAPVLSNLSQNQSIRKYLLDEKNLSILQRLLPFVGYKESVVRRGGVVGTLKNCCFESEKHEWLLCDEVDVLPVLLLPLAGNEEFDEEDNDKLPLELQYLPEDKERESDPDIRLILIEALTQLCTKRVNREYIRSKNAYVILRELHKVEKEESVIFALENLVNIIIRTEEEIGEENLKSVEIPENILNKFNEVEIHD